MFLKRSGSNFSGFCQWPGYRLESRTYLEWEGTFQGHSVAGMTVFMKDTAGLIENIRLYHRPYDMVIAFSADLTGRLAGKITVDPFSGSASEGIP